MRTVAHWDGDRFFASVEQAADRRRVGLWTKFLGAGKDCRKITREEWARLSRERAAGELAEETDA